MEMLRTLICLGGFTMLWASAHANAADLDRGVEAYVRGDFKTALSEFKPLADKGDPMAQYHICEMHIHGKGAAQNFVEAARWCEKAAEAGIPEAQTAIAGLKMLGIGTQRDYQDGYFWIVVSAIWSKGELRTAAMNALTQVSRMIGPDDKADIAAAAVRAWKQ